MGALQVEMERGRGEASSTSRGVACAGRGGRSSKSMSLKLLGGIDLSDSSSKDMVGLRLAINGGKGRPGMG